MIDLQIERPIPMPRVLVVNIGLKIRLRLAISIPFPVSAIETCTPLCSVVSDFMDRTRGSAESIDSMAFITRFKITCCNWTSLPTTGGIGRSGLPEFQCCACAGLQKPPTELTESAY